MLTDEGQRPVIGAFLFMPSEFRQYDDQGFPVAPRFEELQRHDDEPPRKPAISVHTKRLLIVGLVFGVIVPIVFGPRLLSFGRELVAQWYSSRAQKKFWDHDLAGAVKELNCAIAWCPHDFELRWQRAGWRAEQNDLAGSIEDWTECIRLVDSAAMHPLARQQFIDVDHDVLSMLYSDRGWIYVRLGKTREALDDVNKAVELHPSAENLNTRAYARAILNVELTDGLADIEKALKEKGEDDPELLDTRGYLLHLLNRDDEALADLKQAIKLLDNVFPDPRVQERITRSLAVMHYHRSLVLQQLGNTREAERDLKRAERMGFNPANGVL